MMNFEIVLEIRENSVNKLAERLADSYFGVPAEMASMTRNSGKSLWPKKCFTYFLLHSAINKEKDAQDSPTKSTTRKISNTIFCVLKLGTNV